MSLPAVIPASARRYGKPRNIHFVVDRARAPGRQCGLDAPPSGGRGGGAMPAGVFRRSTCGLAAAFILLSVALPARAGFVNGVERFDGAVLDLETWERAWPTGMSQNGAL